MMGRTHAATGALCGLVIATQQPNSIAGVTVIAVAAGAALLPDLDHPQATISRSLGPVSQLVSHGVSAVSGGHRKATHSLLGLVAVTLGVWFFVSLVGAVGAGVLVAGFAALAFMSLGRLGGAIASLLACVVVLNVWVAPPTALWVASAVMAGVLAHIVGDMFTAQGCPLFWPLKIRVGVPAVATNGIVDRFVVGPVAFVATLLVTWWLFHDRFVVDLISWVQRFGSLVLK